MFMGIFWILVGVFFLFRGYQVPKLQLGLGWIVIALGLLRLAWWWKLVEEPKRRKNAMRLQTAEMRKELEEISPKIETNKEVV